MRSYKSPALLCRSAEYKMCIRDRYKMKEICEQSDEMGQFWLTCPPESTFIEEVEKIMGDDVAVLKMYGLSLKEKNGVFPKKNLIDTYRQIWRGGMPAVNDIPQEEKAKYFWHYFNDNLLGQIVESKKIKLPTESVSYTHLDVYKRQTRI